MSSDKDNYHPLTGDFSMYYSGTYVFGMIDGEPQALYVNETERDGDDTKLAGVKLIGGAFNCDGSLGNTFWTADRMDFMRPFSGYFDLGFEQKTYISWTVRNRSQKKGFVAGDVAAPFVLYGKHVAMLYAQSRALHCCPGRRDIYIYEGKLNWKGMEVGDYADDKFTPYEHFKECEAMICRLLQHI